MRKGQLSTEYLVILAVVVIVSLIVVTVLGGFIDIGGGATSQAAKAYWRGADVGILNWRVANGTSEFVLRNNQDYRIKLTDMRIGGVDVPAANDIILNVGKTATVSHTTGLCIPGRAYSLNVSFTYDDVDHSINNLKFDGTKNLDGTCA